MFGVGFEEGEGEVDGLGEVGDRTFKLLQLGEIDALSEKDLRLCNSLRHRANKDVSCEVSRHCRVSLQVLL